MGGRPVSYQPGWKDGREVGIGQRDASGRYETIRRELRGHGRFSVLDVGAYSGYFSIRLAEEFEANVIAADDFPALARLQAPGVTVIPRRLTGDELSRLLFAGVDVTLLLSVLHHVTWWRDMLTLAVERSRVVFVEVPDVREHLPGAVAHAETPNMHAAIQEAGGIVIGRHAGYDHRYDRPLYVIGQM